MVNEVKGTKKNKTVTIRMDERTDKVLGILGSLDLESVPNNSKGEMVTVLIKSIANQILEGKPTFLCRTQELKQILNKKGFDENTFTVITDDDEFKDLAQYDDGIKKLKQAMDYYEKELVEQEKRSDELQKLIDDKEQKLKDLEELYNGKLNDYQIEKPKFKTDNQNIKRATNSGGTNTGTQPTRKAPEVKSSKPKIPSVETISFYDMNGSANNQLYVSEIDSNSLNLGQLVEIAGKDKAIEGKDGRILLNNSNIAKIKNVAMKLFDSFTINQTFNELAEEVNNNKEEIGDDYRIGLVNKAIVGKENYAYPTGIGEYVVYFTDGNGNDFYEIRRYDEPVRKITMSLIDELIDVEIKTSHEFPTTDLETGKERWYSISDLTNYEENLANVKELSENEELLGLVVNYFWKE